MIVVPKPAIPGGRSSTVQTLATPASSATLSEDWRKRTTAVAAVIVKMTNTQAYFIYLPSSSVILILVVFGVPIDTNPRGS